MVRQVPLDDEGSFLLVEDEADRVMPSVGAVCAAGRYDLHHAILFQGGYAAVRARLFWLSVPSLAPEGRRCMPACMPQCMTASRRLAGGAWPGCCCLPI